MIWKHGIFFFGDTHWQEKSGVTVGPPPSCDTATVHLAPKEEGDPVIPCLNHMLIEFLNV